MKYSLKNKEFNKKRLAIFDQNQQRSRSRSTSPTPGKSSQIQRQRIETHANSFNIRVNPPRLNHSVIDKLHLVDSQRSSFQVLRNQEDKSIFQSFAKTQNSRLKAHNAPISNGDALKTCQPLKINHSQAVKLQSGKNEKNSNNNESFQIRQQQSLSSLSRNNRFFAQSILRRQSESPQNKVVFEAVVRTSKSKTARSLFSSPNQGDVSKITNQYSINFKTKPQLYNQSQSNPPFRQVIFQQRPRQIRSYAGTQQNERRSMSPIKQQNNLMNFLGPKLVLENKNNEAEEVIFLKKKVEEQNLQIQYLKNQKQILESNIQLKFSPKEGKYQNYSSPRHVTPQKYGVSFSNGPINQQLDRNKIVQLADILKANQLQIHFVQNKLIRVNEHIIKRFNQAFFKCQQKLIKIFSEKYAVFSEQLRVKLELIDKKHNQISALDTKIDVFTNTFRTIFQNLRITKLKQENIQLLIENSYKKTQKFWNAQEPSRLLQNQSDISSIIRFDDNQFQEKDREELYKLSKNIHQKNRSHPKNTQEVVDYDSFLQDKYSHLIYRKQQLSNQKSKKELHFKKKETQNILFSRKKQESSFTWMKQKSPQKNHIKIHRINSGKNHEVSGNNTHNLINNKSISGQIQQFSPFQANEMFKNEKSARIEKQQFVKYFQKPDYEKVKPKSGQSFDQQIGKAVKNKVNLSFDENSSKNFDFSRNSFQLQYEFKQTARDQSKQISFNQHNMFKKITSKTNSQKDDISDTLQGEQQRLIRILKNKKYQFPIDCWLDELGCLRKKNQTYIFDQQGSVIMTTSAALKKLKEKKIVL